MTYNENLTDVANRYFTNANINEFKSVPPNLKSIMVDKETLINAIATTHDIHLQIIDNRYLQTFYQNYNFTLRSFREDLLMNRTRQWLDNLLINLSKDEIQRNRDKLLEINHFLDIQKEEYKYLISEDRITISSDPLEGII